MPDMSSRPVRLGTAVDRYGESVSKNTKILRDLTVKLSSSRQEEYIDAANKLAKWLISERAYYQEVRPQIVTILETAAYTLASLLGLRLANDFHISRCTPDLQPRAAAFTALVQAVKPHLSLFPEEHLKSRLVNVFAMIYISPPEPQATSGTSAALTKGLSEGASAAIVKAMAEASSRITPALPTLRMSLSTSPNSTGAYSTHIDQLADQYTLRRAYLNDVKPSLSQDYFAATSRSTSPSVNLPDCPITSRPPLPASVSPIDHTYISTANAFLLRQANFPEQDTYSEDAPPITALMKTQPVQSADPTSLPAAPLVSCHPRPELTLIPRSHMVSLPSPPIIHPPQQSSPLHLDTSRARSLAVTSSPDESVTPLRRASYPAGAGWVTTQPQAVFKAEVQKEQERGREIDNDITTRSVFGTSPEETNAPAVSKLIRCERDGVSPSVGSTTQESPISYQPSSLATDSADGVRPLATSGSTVRVTIPASEPTRVISPHAREKARPVPVQHMPGITRDSAREATAPDVSAEKVYSRPPLSLYSPNLEASRRGDAVGQQGVSASRDTEHTSIEEILVSPAAAAADTNGCQRNAASPHTPRSDVNMTMENGPQTKTGQRALSERLLTDHADGVETGEVEQVAIPGDEMRRSGAVAVSPQPVQTADGQSRSHVNVDVTAHNQPNITLASLPSAENTGDSVICAPPVETTPSLSKSPAQGEGPTHTSSSSALHTSHVNSTSVSQNADASPPADTAQVLPTSVPAIELESGAIDAHADVDTDALRDAPNMLEAIGKAGIDEPTHVDSVNFQAWLEMLRVVGPVAAGLQAVVETSDRSRGEEAINGEGVSGKDVMVAREARSGHAKNKDGVADDDTAAGSETNRNREGDCVQERGVGEALPGGSGKKRERSPSSDRAAAEHPSNKARRDEEKGFKREASQASGEIIHESPRVHAEELPGGKEDVGGDGLLTSSVGHPIREESVPGEKDPSSQTCVDATENVTALGAPSETSRAELFTLPLSDYHPTEPYATIAIVTGLPMAGTQEVRLELDEEQATSMKRWRDWCEGLECSSLCISMTLICTHVPDRRPLCEGEGAAGTDAMQDVIRWPSGGRFWITAEADDRAPVSISLSPPDLIEAYEPLDLSFLIGQRRTTLRFTQTEDHAEYRFVLRAHPPTAAQLLALDGVALAERTLKAGFGAPLPAFLRSGLFSPASAT